MVVYLQEVLMNISVVVSFLSQVIFVFVLFLGMVLYCMVLKLKIYKGKIKITGDKKLTTTY